IALALAINFLAVVGGVGYLWRSGHLDRDRITAIKALLYPPATQPTQSGPATQPTLSLDDLVRKAAGRPAEDQVEFLQRSFDARVAELDLRQRQLTDQQREVDLARQKLSDERSTLEKEKADLAAQQQAAAQEAGDTGFQDSLQLYVAMPPAKVKDIFMTLEDGVVVKYLEAMDPSKAGKVVKEFKTPDEMNRIQKILEKMRLAQN
ncbi:MAG TPA: hypothetical protein VL992_11580, partial [Tepidisphaeraceae bacterium]|nr:hypothetical protein [Tepidisphaeraceae bacterium]